MSEDGHEMGIEPDYKLSPQIIYSDLVIKYVNATGSVWAKTTQATQATLE
jgi:hypothetical protein